MALSLSLVPLLAAGCMKPQGYTTQEKRDYVQNMEQQTLAELYRRHPDSRRVIENSAGYGVFSDVGAHLVWTTAGNGYGVVTDRRTGRKTFMRMAEFGGGIGLGVEQFRAVLAFNDEATLKKFISSGWEFGGEADATAQMDTSGGSVGAARSASHGITTYRLTEDGVMAQVSLTGTKYWVDSSLN
jgi:lipid-binding SYLF domain-containing protein